MIQRSVISRGVDGKPLAGEQPGVYRFELQKATPKQIAQDAVRSALEAAFYWDEQGHTEGPLTEREKALISAQVGKLVARIERML